MNTTDLLIVGIEVSVAFTGFAGIIATVQFTDKESIQRGEIVGITVIVNIGLMAAFFSVLPLLLSTFELEETNLWMICSCLATFYTVYIMYFIHKNIRDFIVKSHTRWLFRVFQGIAALAVIGLILNISDIVFHREAGPYVAAIAVGLALVGYMFARLLLRPLWKVIKEKEESSSTSAGSV